MIRCGTVVLGGGPAGAATASILAAGGEDVCLLERTQVATHKVCGEFLSVETVAMLQQLGVEPGELHAETIEHVRLAAGGTEACAPLGFAAASLTRHSMDEALLLAAQHSGVRVQRGAAIEILERTGSRWEVGLADGSRVLAERAVLATGKHDLRGRPRPSGRQSDLVAFKMYWRLAPAQAEALHGHVEVALFRDGYAGLQRVEGGAANLCCVVRKRRLRDLGGRWERVLEAMTADCALLRERMRGAEPLLAKPLSVSAIPYGMVRRATEEGLWRVGDQAAVIPSFTGEGMAMALRGGILAARSMLDGQTANDFQRAFADAVEPQVSFATRLSRWMVHGWAQQAALPVVKSFPRILTAIAGRTRLREPY